MGKRRVIITGGSRGIGAACVKIFASCGDTVAFIYRNDDAAAAAVSAETGAHSFKFDISDYDNAAKAIETAASYLGGCDVLVNCAGIAGIRLFTDETKDEYEKMVSTNLTGAVVSSRTAAKKMIEQHSGVIINIGSVWGARGASCEVTYSATKAALRGFTSALSKELGPSGIRVNCVEPGVIDTDMNACLDDETKKELSDGTSLCRLGRAEDVADAVFYLASDSASFITGAILPVDGGFIS